MRSRLVRKPALSPQIRNTSIQEALASNDCVASMNSGIQVCQNSRAASLVAFTLWKALQLRINNCFHEVSKLAMKRSS
jgi:hypothetical protein